MASYRFIEDEMRLFLEEKLRTAPRYVKGLIWAGPLETWGSSSSQDKGIAFPRESFKCTECKAFTACLVEGSRASELSRRCAWERLEEHTLKESCIPEMVSWHKEFWQTFIRQNKGLRQRKRVGLTHLLARLSWRRLENLYKRECVPLVDIVGLLSFKANKGMVWLTRYESITRKVISLVEILLSKDSEDSKVKKFCTFILEEGLKERVKVLCEIFFLLDESFYFKYKDLWLDMWKEIEDSTIHLATVSLEEGKFVSRSLAASDIKYEYDEDFWNVFLPIIGDISLMQDLRKRFPGTVSKESFTAFLEVRRDRYTDRVIVSAMREEGIGIPEDLMTFWKESRIKFSNKIMEKLVEGDKEFLTFVESGSSRRR